MGLCEGIIANAGTQVQRLARSSAWALLLLLLLRVMVSLVCKSKPS